MTQEVALTRSLGVVTFNFADAVAAEGVSGNLAETKSGIVFDFGPGAHLHLFTVVVTAVNLDGGVVPPLGGADTVVIRLLSTDPAIAEGVAFFLEDQGVVGGTMKKVAVTGPALTPHIDWINTLWTTPPGAGASFTLNFQALTTSALTA
jgi:hypothetical protein